MLNAAFVTGVQDFAANKLQLKDEGGIGVFFCETSAKNKKKNNNPHV